MKYISAYMVSLPMNMAEKNCDSKSKLKDMIGASYDLKDIAIEHGYSTSVNCVFGASVFVGCDNGVIHLTGNACKSPPYCKSMTENKCKRKNGHWKHDKCGGEGLSLCWMMPDCKSITEDKCKRKNGHWEHDKCGGENSSLCWVVPDCKSITEDKCKRKNGHWEHDKCGGENSSLCWVVPDCKSITEDKCKRKNGHWEHDNCGGENSSLCLVVPVLNQYEIKSIKCLNLQRKDVFNNSDPYLQIVHASGGPVSYEQLQTFKKQRSPGPNTKFTCYQKNTMNPKWSTGDFQEENTRIGSKPAKCLDNYGKFAERQLNDMTYIGTDSTRLYITVWDKDDNDDDLIGFSKIPFRNWTEGTKKIKKIFEGTGKSGRCTYEIEVKKKICDLSQGPYDTYLEIHKRDYSLEGIMKWGEKRKVGCAGFGTHEHLDSMLKCDKGVVTLQKKTRVPEASPGKFSSNEKSAWDAFREGRCPNRYEFLKWKMSKWVM